MHSYRRTVQRPQMNPQEAKADKGSRFSSGSWSTRLNLKKGDRVLLSGCGITIQVLCYPAAALNNGNPFTKQNMINIGSGQKIG